MTATLQAVAKRVSDGRKVINPADLEKSEDLAGRLTDNDWQVFRQKLQAFSEVATKAIESDDELVACSL